jgi:hypothetical protein
MSLIPILTGRSNFVATGGTIYTQGGFTYHRFTETGSFAILSGRRDLQFIAVGGGGAGGKAAAVSGSNYSYGGGGGGGGVSQTSYASSALSNISINIGAGGSASGPSTGFETQVIASLGGTPLPILTANGGGYGADPSQSLNALNGASGGGAGIKVISGFTTSYAAGAGDGVTGFNGGTVISGTGAGSGGGKGGGSASAGGSGPLAGGSGITSFNAWFNDGTSALGTGGLGGRLVSDFPITNYGEGGKGGATFGAQSYSPSSGRNGVVVIRYAV